MIPVKIACERLKDSGELFLELGRFGNISVEIYGPKEVDLQGPHEEDELYVIISGFGRFQCEGQIRDFEPGDLIFVPARAEHRFVSFSDDFRTWVIFVGG